jgi:hypothetical protein
VTPDNTTKELMTPSDKVILMYRDKLKEWDGLGWRIDFDRLQRESKKVAYAIPGPARREHKGWVLDPVPVVQANSEQAELTAVG